MFAEQPTYVVFNGLAYGFTSDAGVPMEAATGETARVYFANGSPNLLSTWHPIGNVWSRLYRDGDLLTDPELNIETAPVVSGTTAAGEMEFPVLGLVKIIEHALTRAARHGALDITNVSGEPTRDVSTEDP